MAAACPVLGFLVEIALDPRVSQRASDALWGEFEKLLEKRALDAEGIRRRHHWKHQVRGEATQATDVDRTAIQEWAATQAAIISCRVSVVHDLEASH